MNLLGALSLRTDKSSYRLGETPTYILEGGTPGAALAWTSYQDGNNTQEYQAQYGQYLDNSGNASLVAGGPWTAAYKGYWKKEVLAIAPDGSVEVARVNFSVSEDGSPVTAPPVVQPGAGSNAGAGGDLFTGNFDLPVIGSVPKLAVIAGVGLLIFFLTSKK